MLNKSRCHACFHFQPIRLLDPGCWYKFTYWMTNSADPDQVASSEATWSGSTHCLQRHGISGFCRTRVNNFWLKKMPYLRAMNIYIYIYIYVYIYCIYIDLSALCEWIFPVWQFPPDTVFTHKSLDTSAPYPTCSKMWTDTNYYLCCV